MKVLVTVEKGSDGFFWCRTEDDIHKGYLTACGSDVATAKEDLLVCLKEACEDFAEQGLEVPDIEFTYKYDLQSFFNYFSYINPTEVARRSGINTSQMRQYTSGVKNASEATYAKIAACVAKIKQDIQAATL